MSEAETTWSRGETRRDGDVEWMRHCCRERRMKFSSPEVGAKKEKKGEK